MQDAKFAVWVLEKKYRDYLYLIHGRRLEKESSRYELQFAYNKWEISSENVSLA